MAGVLEIDYLVVGAGAMGMAFADALVDHCPARVGIVDRRHAAGGHWLEAYPFVQLHQASALYGVASTRLGNGRLQEHGPEAGLHERATQPEIVAYFAAALERLVETGRVEAFLNCDFEGSTIVSRVSGERFEVPDSCRIVNAHYLAPSIPAETPAPFAVGDDARLVTVNDLARLEGAPGHYVVVGSGKTATDACVWLLARGVDPDAICWVRPRDPWMLDRARVQPHPAIFHGLTADVLEAAATASDAADFFLRLEDADVMLRIDPHVTPTMAKAPTLARWELDQLRTLDHVVRRGHLTSVSRGRLGFADGSIAIAADAVVVHCAADGLKYPPLVPLWRREEITLQPIRAGFPSYGAAITGYVEATRSDDEEKNRLCAPSNLPDTPASWAAMTYRGARATKAFSAEPDIKEWADGVTLNPMRIPPGQASLAALDEARQRIQACAPAAMKKLAAFAGEQTGQNVGGFL